MARNVLEKQIGKNRDKKLKFFLNIFKNATIKSKKKDPVKIM